MSEHNHPTRDSRIFDLGLSVETVSLYLLISGLTDEGKSPTREEIKQIWNASQAALDNSLAELERKNIIRRFTAGDGRVTYGVVDSSGWVLS